MVISFVVNTVSETRILDLYPRQWAFYQPLHIRVPPPPQVLNICRLRPFHGGLHLFFEFWPRYSMIILSQKCSTLNKFLHEHFYKQKLPVIIEVSFEKVAHFPKVPAHTGLTTLDCRKRRHWKSQNWRAVRICEWFKPWCNVLKDQQLRELRRIRTTCCAVYLYDNANEYT